MTLPYYARLVCLALACFFALHCVLSLAVRCALPCCLRFARSCRPAQAARLLLALRFFPPLAAILTVGSLCVPSYLWFEEPGSAEKAGAACLTAALLALLGLSASLLRAFMAVLRTRRFVRHDAPRPPLLLSGIWSPRLHVSDALVKALRAESLAAALRHEEAHRASWDNLKRLLLLLAPDVFPFVGIFRPLDRHWERLAEWAADDRAVAGDRQRALHLAQALVQVARMGVAAMPPLPVSLLLTAEEDLAIRVNRLLVDKAVCERSPRLAWVPSIAALCLGAIAVAIWTHPEALYPLHDFLELLMC